MTYQVRIRKPWREAFSFGGRITDRYKKRKKIIMNDSLWGDWLYPLQARARDYFAYYYGFWFSDPINGEPHAQITDYKLDRMRDLHIPAVDHFLHSAPFIRLHTPYTSCKFYAINNKWMCKYLDDYVIEVYQSFL